MDGLIHYIKIKMCIKVLIACFFFLKKFLITKLRLLFASFYLVHMVALGTKIMREIQQAHQAIVCSSRAEPTLGTRAPLRPWAQGSVKSDIQHLSCPNVTVQNGLPAGYRIIFNPIKRSGTLQSPLTKLSPNDSNFKILNSKRPGRSFSYNGHCQLDPVQISENGRLSVSNG